VLLALDIFEDVIAAEVPAVIAQYHIERCHLHSILCLEMLLALYIIFGCILGA
jgi:hypothetical protein